MNTLTEMNWKRYGATFVLCCVALALAGCSDRKSEQYRAEGDTLRGMKRIEAARTAYENSLEANPENPMAKLGLARCSVAEGNTNEALTLFKEAIEMDPTLDEAYGEAVRMLAGADRMDEALALCDDYVEHVPEKGGTLYGAVLLKMGRTEDALQMLSELGQSYPDSEPIQLELGAAYLKAGQSDSAEEIFRKLVERGGGSVVAARMGLVDVYRAQGRTHELVEEFAVLTESRPEDLGIKLGYARSLLLADRAEEAEATAREILEANPESGWANYIVGYGKTKAGDFEEAIAYLEQAVRELPEEAGSKDIVGSCPEWRGGAHANDEESCPHTCAGRCPSRVDLERSLEASRSEPPTGQSGVIHRSGWRCRARSINAGLLVYVPSCKSSGFGCGPAGDIEGERVSPDAFFSKDPALVAAHFESWKEDRGAEDNILRDNALGFAMVATGSREQGLSVFLFCLERWPDHGVALFNIAQVFRRLGQPMIAAQNLQRLIAMYPENIDAHQMLYTALQEGKAFDAARRAAEASYTLFPEERWSHLYLCQAYLNTGEPAPSPAVAR